MDFTARLSQADFISDLKALAEAGLELEPWAAHPSFRIW